MRIYNYFFHLFLAAFTIILINDSFATGRPLKTEDINITEVKGTFTLIFFGGRYSNDFETIAFLDLEGDGYTFEPYAPGFDYRVKKGVPAKEAFKEAEQFVSQHPDFSRSLLSRILDKEGKIIGYELRPLYYPLRFGISDILDIDYWINNGKVKIIIRLIPSVERQLFGGDGSKDSDH